MKDPRIGSKDAPSFMQIAKQEKAHDSDVNCVRWNPTQTKLLASCGDDMVVKLWTIEDLEQATM
jgi:WD40 repeat protein